MHFQLPVKAGNSLIPENGIDSLSFGAGKDFVDG